MRVLVVDDERPARDRLIRMLARIPGIELAGQAENGKAALAQIAKLKPDLVLLDVEMPGLDGLAVAERQGLPPIVFTTGHSQFAATAFDVDAVDYLVKPVRQERLEEALERVRRRGGAGAAAADHRIQVHEGGAVKFVDARDVLAFRALDKYVEFATGGVTHLTRESLDALVERFADLGFVRVHRSAAVRRDGIVEVASGSGATSIKLFDGSAVEVSRRQAAELRRLLGLRR